VIRDPQVGEKKIQIRQSTVRQIFLITIGNLQGSKKLPISERTRWKPHLK